MNLLFISIGFNSFLSSFSCPYREIFPFFIRSFFQFNHESGEECVTDRLSVLLSILRSFFFILVEKPLPMVAPGDVMSVVGLLLAGGVTLGIAITVMVLNMRKQCSGAAESDSYVQCSLLSRLFLYPVYLSLLLWSRFPLFYSPFPILTEAFGHNTCHHVDVSILPMVLCYPHAPLLSRFLCQPGQTLLPLLKWPLHPPRGSRMMTAR